MFVITFLFFHASSRITAGEKLALDRARVPCLAKQARAQLAETLLPDDICEFHGGFARERDEASVVVAA